MDFKRMTKKSKLMTRTEAGGGVVWSLRLSSFSLVVSFFRKEGADERSTLGVREGGVEVARFVFTSWGSVVEEFMLKSKRSINNLDGCGVCLGWRLTKRSSTVHWLTVWKLEDWSTYKFIMGVAKKRNKKKKRLNGVRKRNLFSFFQLHLFFEFSKSYFQYLNLSLFCFFSSTNDEYSVWIMWFLNRSLYFVTDFQKKLNNIWFVFLNEFVCRLYEQSVVSNNTNYRAFQNVLSSFEENGMTRDP